MIPLFCILVQTIFSLTLISSQTIPTENVVIYQQSNHFLQCPISSADCTNVQWQISEGDAINVIGNGVNVYQRYKDNYYINSTAGYCMLRIVNAAVDVTAGHINCLNLADGTAIKAFYIYVIGNGPNCSANVQSADGFATNGSVLTYTCDMTFSSGSPTGGVDLTWLSSQLIPLPNATVNVRDPKKISIAYELVALQPYVPQLVCRASFGHKDASATVIQEDCVVKVVNVKYPVTTVRIQGDDLKPGGNISCIADGIPLPTIIWLDSSTREAVSNGSVLNADDLIGRDMGEYHCEAYNTLNDKPVMSYALMINDTFFTAVSVGSAASWLIPVIVCVPLGILLILVLFCCICPCCPINKSIKNRRKTNYPVKEKSRPLEPLNGPSSVTFMQPQPILKYQTESPQVQDPVPRPRSSQSNRQGPPSNNSSFMHDSSLTRAVPPPHQQPLLSGAGAGMITSDLLYANMGSPTPSQASKTSSGQARPARAKPQSSTIYTPVVRS